MIAGHNSIVENINSIAHLIYYILAVITILIVFAKIYIRIKKDYPIPFTLINFAFIIISALAYFKVSNIADSAIFGITGYSAEIFSTAKYIYISAFICNYILVPLVFFTLVICIYVMIASFKESSIKLLFKNILYFFYLLLLVSTLISMGMKCIYYTKDINNELFNTIIEYDFRVPAQQEYVRCALKKNDKIINLTNSSILIYRKGSDTFILNNNCSKMLFV